MVSYSNRSFPDQVWPFYRTSTDASICAANKKGKPFSFKLGAGEVIKGWDIGVMGMAVGGERRLTIPAHLAYGSKGSPPSIPPNSKLIFDLKVLGVK
jgi:FK506-binding nuclear protein